MKRTLVLAGCVWAWAAGAADLDALTKIRSVDAKRKSADKAWKAYDTRTLDLAAPAVKAMTPPALSPYGGRMDRRGRATGFFRVERAGPGWTMFDPDGCEYLCVGMCSVSMNSTTRGCEALTNRFGSTEGWAQGTFALLHTNGFNALANWSATDNFRAPARQLPRMPNLDWMGGYGRKRGGVFQKPGHLGYPGDCIFVFDPGFETHCRAQAAKLAAQKDDPWILGYFADNEMPLSGKLLSRFLALPEKDAGRVAADEWWKARRGDETRKPAEADEAAFQELVAERYCRIVREALRAHDPNHLFLGPRLHGGDLKTPALVRGCGRQVDVFSFNYYGAWTPDPAVMDLWLKEGGRPFMITEWYCKGVDSGMANTTGAGWLAKTQADRGAFYQNFVLGLLAHPGAVGWHWFKYIDNDPTSTKADPSNLDSNKGVVSMVYEPYAPLLDAMRELNTRVYPLADALRAP